MSETVIELRDVNFKYNKEEKNVLNNISLSIKKGSWLAVIGPNGSGKSTLAKVMNGLISPNSGEVYINNTLLDADTVWDARQAVGMVFQNPDNQFVGATVEDDVAFGLENAGIPRDQMQVRVKEALVAVNMQDFLKSEPARLSGGQKQRVAIAGLLALRPDVIILDEATAMLDPKGRKEVLNAIKALKEEYPLTVISITHDIDEASQANQIIVLKEGQIIKTGSPKEVFSLGDELIEMGLDLPFAQKLTNALRERNVKLPNEYMTEGELIKWIQSNLKK